MAVTLSLAKPADLERLERLVAAYHDFEGIETTQDDRFAALTPLLEGTPHGVAYLIGPPKSPVGYVVVSFGWSVELGGIDGFVDELFIRPGVRGRGMGSEALAALLPALARNGVTALHLEVATTNAEARQFYRRLGFEARDSYHLMTQRLRPPR